MIEYFKFTGGDAFTLSGKDYNGFINVRNGIVYSGKSLTSSSKVLSSKDTFLSNSFILQKEFDNISNILLFPHLLFLFLNHLSVQSKPIQIKIHDLYLCIMY